MTSEVKNSALEAAQQAQMKINEALDAGRSFRLEAGAGAATDSDFATGGSQDESPVSSLT